MPKQPSRATSGRYVSRLTSGALAVVMAGGRGERLRDLTLHRCKPATPFGGKFRIIDFVLSNCVNSGIRQIYLMTQYKGQSLIQHVQRGWSYLQRRVRRVHRRGTRAAAGRQGMVSRHRRLCLPEPRPDPRAAAQARTGARRRPYLQDGLRSDGGLPRRKRRRHHRRGGGGTARARARFRRTVGHRVEPCYRFPREAARTRFDPGAPRRRVGVDGHLHLQRPAAREAADRRCRR